MLIYAEPKYKLGICKIDVIPLMEQVADAKGLGPKR